MDIRTFCPASLIVAVTGSVLIGTASGAVHQITTADGIGADAFVAAFAPATNFGDAPQVLVKNAMPANAAAFYRKAYLRFDLSELNDANAASAELQMTIGQPSGSPGGDGLPVSGEQSFSVFGLVDANAGEAWDELTITWLNAPANVTNSGNALTAAAVSLGQFTLEGIGTPGETVSLASPSLSAFINQDTNARVTLIVVRDTFDPNVDGWIHRFISKEDENVSFAPPTLTIVTPLAADFDKDGDVDGEDFLIWQSAFPTLDGTATSNSGDANGDGQVSGEDFLIWQGEFGSGVQGVGRGALSVPEPSVGLMVLSGLAMILARRPRSYRHPGSLPRFLLRLDRLPHAGQDRDQEQHHEPDRHRHRPSPTAPLLGI